MASVTAVLRTWEAAIKHLQALASDDLPVLRGPVPGIVTSVRAAASLDVAVQGVIALPQGNKKACSKLLAQKV